MVPAYLFIYDDANHLTDIRFSDNFSDRFIKCGQDNKSINKFNLLDDEFCFLFSVLDHVKDDYSFKDLKPGNFVLDVGIQQLKSFTTFFNGSNLKKLNLKVIDKLLKSMYVELANFDNTGKFDYEKTFIYNNDRSIKMVITKDITENKIVKKLQYTYTTSFR